MREPSREPGFSLVEVVIGLVILGGALIPIYSTFIASARGVSNSRMAYMALQVARETMEELRQVPKDQWPEDWRATSEAAWQTRTAATNRALPGATVDGPLFAFTARVRSRVGDDNYRVATPGEGRAIPVYPDEYRRIRRLITWMQVGPTLKKVALVVTWEELGGTEEGRHEKVRPGMFRYLTLIGEPVDQEVTRL